MTIQVALKKDSLNIMLTRKVITHAISTILTSILRSVAPKRLTILGHPIPMMHFIVTTTDRTLLRHQAMWEGRRLCSKTEAPIHGGLPEVQGNICTHKERTTVIWSNTAQRFVRKAHKCSMIRFPKRNRTRSSTANSRSKSWRSTRTMSALQQVRFKPRAEPQTLIKI